MAYIGTQPKDVRSFGRAKFDFTATQGQTAFTGADDDSKTLGFTDGQIEVYVNGILMDESDFTTSNGNTVTLGSAANLNDIISIVAMQTDIPNSDYVPASGGTFTGAVTHSGNVTFSGTTSGIDMNGTELVLDADGDTSITADTDDRIDFKIAGSDRGNLHYDGNDYFSLESNDYLTLVQNQTAEKGIIFGPTYFKPYNAHDNTLDLGIGAARWKDLYLSGGVYLGGTAAANKLDDYETGTFSTALLQATSSTPSYSVNANRNKYVKIGKLVLAHFDFSFISLSGGSGDVLLNLPFTVNGTENYHSVHAMRNCSAFQSPIADHKVHGYGGANSTLIYLLYETGNSGAEAAINMSSLQNGRINLDFIYTTSD